MSVLTNWLSTYRVQRASALTAATFTIADLSPYVVLKSKVCLIMAVCIQETRYLGLQCTHGHRVPDGFGFGSRRDRFGLDVMQPRRNHLPWFRCTSGVCQHDAV